tara:strand:- start:19916 stop:21148 length:1233 start_codon:yes stop_codon:yes gene_type:complete
MKIYNEVIIDMNPESSSYGDTLSEDSFEHKGDIDLCRQSAKFNQHTGQWGWWTSPGSNIHKVRKNISGHGHYAPLHYGATHPVERVAGQRIGTVSKSDVSLGAAKDRFENLKSLPNFETAYYNPARTEALLDPVRDMGQVIGGDQDPNDPELAAFTEFQGNLDPNIFPTAGAVAGYDRLLPTEGDLARNLELLEEERTAAEVEFQDQMSMLKEQKADARTAFTAGTDELATQRRRVALGAEEEFEQAEIQHGATGMAQSAAAEEGYKMEGSGMTMQDLKSQENILRKGHAGEIKKTESKELAEEDKWRDAQRTYHLGVEQLYKQATTALDESMIVMNDVLNAWKDPGATLDWKNLGDTGWGTTQYFGDTTRGDIAGHVATFKDRHKTAETFAEKMEKDAGAAASTFAPEV